MINLLKEFLNFNSSNTIKILYIYVTCYYYMYTTYTEFPLSSAKNFFLNHLVKERNNYYIYTHTHIVHVQSTLYTIVHVHSTIYHCTCTQYCIHTCTCTCTQYDIHVPLLVDTRIKTHSIVINITTTLKINLFNTHCMYTCTCNTHCMYTCTCMLHLHIHVIVVTCTCTCNTHIYMYM